MLSYSGAVYSKFKDKINVMIEIRNVEREMKSLRLSFFRSFKFRVKKYKYDKKLRILKSAMSCL